MAHMMASLLSFLRQSSFRYLPHGSPYGSSRHLPSLSLNQKRARDCPYVPGCKSVGCSLIPRQAPDAAGLASAQLAARRAGTLSASHLASFQFTNVRRHQLVNFTSSGTRSGGACTFGLVCKVPGDQCGCSSKKQGTRRCQHVAASPSAAPF